MGQEFGEGGWVASKNYKIGDPSGEGQVSFSA